MSRTLSRFALLICAVLAGALLLCTPARAADLSADEIVAHMQDALFPGKDLRARMEVTATNTYGESIYLLASYYRIGDKLQRIVLDGPPELRGFEFSAERRDGKPPRVHIYMPVVRRVRELDVNMLKESFLGTDFNYEDLGFENLAGEDHRLLGEFEQDGRRYYRVESVPKKQDWMYEKLERLIDARTFLPIETKYYCWGVDLCRVRRIEQVAHIGGYDVATDITMSDVIQHQTTQIKLTDVEVDVGLSADLFRYRSERTK